jgi:hypothetical protein
VIVQKELRPCTRGRGRSLRKGKRGFIKDHVARDDYVIGLMLETKVALVVRGIPEKNTEGGARGKFVGGAVADRLG